MAPSNFDINLQLALATTAEQEGDVVTALDFLSEAHQLSRTTDRVTRARVLLQTIRLRLRLPRLLAFA